MFSCNVCQREEEGFHNDIGVKTVTNLMKEFWLVDREEEPNLEVVTFDDELDFISVNTFKAIDKNFKATKKTAVMQKYLGETFSQDKVKDLAVEFDYNLEWINTYNRECVLDHTLQMAVLYNEGEDWIYDRDKVVVVSYHYTGDVRTNYSPYLVLEPYVEFEDFIWGLNRLYAFDGEGNNWESFDAGYSWEYHGINEKDLTTTDFYDKLSIENEEVYWNGNKLNFSSRLVE